MFEKLGLDEATERAKASGKYLLIDFTAEWCGPCKQMDKTTWKDPSIHAWVAEHAIAIQLDSDANESVAHKWNIQALPTVVLRKGDAELDRASGMRSAPQLLAWVEIVKSGGSELDIFRKVDATDVSGRFKLATELQKRGHFEEALEHFVWLWECSLNHRPAWSGVRSSYLTGEIESLLARYDAARVRFEAIRRATNDFGDWVTLSQTLGHDDDVVARVSGLTATQAIEMGATSNRRLLDMLEARGELRLLGNLLAEPVRLLRDELAIFEQVLSKAKPEWGDALGESHHGFTETLTKRQATYARALEDAGREAEAADVRALDLHIELPDLEA